MLERIIHNMEGTYKYDDCTVKDPIVTIYDIGRDLSTGLTKGEVNLTDPLDPSNGATFFFSDKTEPLTWTVLECQIWVENYLQRYKI